MFNPMNLLLAGMLIMYAGCTDQPHQQRAAKEKAAVAESGRPVDDLLRATYSPLHFQPAIAFAADAQCLACHQEILDDKVRPASPAGVATAKSVA